MRTQKKRVSIADVANSAGVSKVAVSYVLNNRPGEVGPETRQRIMQAIRDLGYRPPPSKRTGERGRCDILGLVAGCEAIELARTSYYNAVFQGILEETPHFGVHMTMFAGDMFEVDTMDKVRSYCDGRCDGLLLLGLRSHSTIPAILDERGMPYVIIGDPTEIPGALTVDVDHEHGIRLLIEHLLYLGHKRIGFMGGPDFVTAAELRYDIFNRAAQEFGFTPYDLHPVNGPPDEPVEEWITEVMQREPEDRPTAFIGWNDRSAVIAVRHLRSLGYRVPQDVSIVRFDDIETFGDLRLTSYRQPSAEIGKRAVTLCLERFENPTSTPRVDLIRGKLMIRESSGPAPA